MKGYAMARSTVLCSLAAFTVDGLSLKFPPIHQHDSTSDYPSAIRSDATAASAELQLHPPLHYGGALQVPIPPGARYFESRATETAQRTHGQAVFDSISTSEEEPAKPKTPILNPKTCSDRFVSNNIVQPPAVREQVSEIVGSDTSSDHYSPSKFVEIDLNSPTKVSHQVDAHVITIRPDEITSGLPVASIPTAISLDSNTFRPPPVVRFQRAVQNLFQWCCGRDCLCCGCVQGGICDRYRRPICICSITAILLLVAGLAVIMVRVFVLMALRKD